MMVDISAVFGVWALVADGALLPAVGVAAVVIAGVCVFVDAYQTTLVL